MKTYTHNGDSYRSSTNHLFCVALVQKYLDTSNAFLSVAEIMAAYSIDAATATLVQKISRQVHKVDNRGQFVTDVGATSFVEISSTSLASQTELQLLWGILSLGGECFNVDAWIEVDAANYNDVVPVGMPNRSYTDENDNEVLRDWAGWHNSTHEHEGPWDGKYYISGASYGSKINASELYAGSLGTGVTIRTLPEFKAIQAANAPDEGV